MKGNLILDSLRLRFHRSACVSSFLSSFQIMGKLSSLTISDFKSYRGLQTLGPFRSFTAVIGPNGSGKSNLMDAVSFVLGLKSSHLRSSQLKELVYKGPSDYTPTDCFVQMHYETDDGEVLFRRRVVRGGSEYLIDGDVCSYEVYAGRLEDMGM